MPVRTLFLLTVLAAGSALLLNVPAAHAQERATLEGSVVEAGSGAPLAAVNVTIEGTVIGVSTAFDGSYALRNLQPGTYTVAASLIGFERQTQTVTLEPGEVTTLNFQLAEGTVTLDEILAQEERPYSAASSVALRGFDLRTRPTRSTQDLLRLAPGLFIAQHAGGGKAEQIFLRGFDADHGTDVAISVDGIPVNMVSHGHGQGYADLHFIIPETVEEMDVQKGPYAARLGNLATAGAVSFHTRDHFDYNLLRLEGGNFSTGEMTAIYQIPLPGQHQGAYVAAQFYNTDGPVETPQGLQRANLFGKFHTHLSGTSTLALSLSGFSSAWDASGQIPQRAVDQGFIDRFGAIDDLEGGTTGRQDLNLTYEVHGSDNSELVIQSYLSRYNFKLFSNFTFFLEDPLDGDMIEQTDDRRIVGLNSRYRFTRMLGGTVATTSIGGGFRADDIDVALWQSPERIRRAALVDARIIERNLDFWIQEEFVFSPLLRLQLGLRGDYFTFNVEDALEGTPADLPHASGYAQQAILSPKASLVVSPTSAVDVFLNFGTGFHSNDARDVIIGQRVADITRSMRRKGAGDADIDAALEARNLDPAHREIDTLPRAVGGEIGTRARLGRRVNVAAALWLLDLESEFVFVGDGGFTEASGATRRSGLDLEARAQLARWIWADADLNLARGRFVDEPEGADRIPLAPRLTSTGGVTVRHPGGLESSLRYRHIDDRPANEDESVVAEGYTVLDLVAAYPFAGFRLNLALENIFDVDWNEAQFDTESRLFGEPAPISELHFTPGNPRNIRIGVSYLF